MRNFKTEGIIIKRRNFKDSDRVLTVLTKTHGKIYVRASGVRKITSRRAGHIELLNHTLLTLYKGNSYPILTEATTINNYSDIKSDFGSVGLAYHLCELVDGLCPENQENMQVFELLRKTLNDLTLGGNSTSIINEFEMQLLSLLGYSNRANYLTIPDTGEFIENILERKLKSKKIFAKLQQ